MGPEPRLRPLIGLDIIHGNAQIGGGRVMPVHDWTRVDAEIFHAFHHYWISAIGDSLNAGLLPEDFYSLPELHGGGLGPDVPAIRGWPDEQNEAASLEFCRRKQNTVTVRHV